MGLLDSVIGGLFGGGSNNASSGMGGALSGLLGGGGGEREGSQGGIGGLVSSFENAGLGHIAHSWVGNGENQPVSPQQLHHVFGEDRVNQMAGQAGMEPQGFLEQLSQHLPNAVNGMTPNGRVEDEGTVSV